MLTQDLVVVCRAEGQRFAIRRLLREDTPGAPVDFATPLVQQRIGLGLLPQFGERIDSARIRGALAKEAHASGRGVVELVLEKGWLSKDEIDRILSPENLTEPRPPVKP